VKNQIFLDLSFFLSLFTEEFDLTFPALLYNNQVIKSKKGVPAFEGLLVTLLLIAASFVANILAGFVALGMIKKNKVL
jgi:hypothetical protein